MLGVENLELFQVKKLKDINDPRITEDHEYDGKPNQYVPSRFHQSSS